MTVKDLVKRLKRYPSNAEISLVYKEWEGDFGEERLKIWLHPERPDNEKLNPEIFIP
jgi:hypothetical protein